MVYHEEVKASLPIARPTSETTDYQTPIEIHHKQRLSNPGRLHGLAKTAGLGGSGELIRFCARTGEKWPNSHEPS